MIISNQTKKFKVFTDKKFNFIQLCMTKSMYVLTFYQKTKKLPWLKWKAFCRQQNKSDKKLKFLSWNGREGCGKKGKLLLVTIIFSLPLNVFRKASLMGC